MIQPLAFGVKNAAEMAQCYQELFRKMIRSGAPRTVRVGKAVSAPQDEILRLCGEPELPVKLEERREAKN